MMKKSLVVFVLVVLVQLGKVQAQYIPMAVDSAVWFISKTHPITGEPQETYVLYSNGDTVVNNIAYKKIYNLTPDSININTHTLHLLLRDNIFTRTVHGIYSYIDNLGLNCYNGSDVQLFDFNTGLSTGSIVTICSNNYDNVYSVDTFNLYGKDRRVISGTFGSWIEGIGGDAGLTPYSVAAQFILSNYCRGTPSDCGAYAWVSTNETKTFQQGKLFPNPARDQVRLELDHYIQNGTIKIIDTFGRVHQLLGFEGNESSIDIADLAHGMYIVQVFEEDELRYSDKLMVVD